MMIFISEEILSSEQQPKANILNVKSLAEFL